MKKTVKKHLLLVAAIVALMVIFMSGAAAKCDTCMYNPDLDVITYPTCTDEGYTTMKCGVCNEVMGIKDRVKPTGHLFEEEKYEYEDHSTYFYSFCECANTNNGVPCDAVTYKTDENANKIKFYTVTFVNPWSTAGYEEDVTYAKLAKTYSDLELGMIYVAEGGTAQYTGATPLREKDKHERNDSGKAVYGYGAYDFKGWMKPAVSYDPTVTYTADSSALNNITKNTVLHAVFEGRTVQYVIIFTDGDGKPISREIRVTHGVHDPLIDSLFENNPPKKSETSLYKYEFKGWDRDVTAFYGTCTVRPLYNNIEKKYTYVYHDSTGEEFHRVMMTASSQPPVFTQDQIKNHIKKADDNIYIYTWTGEWCHNDNYSNLINPPQQIPGNVKEGEEIHLYPVYLRKLINYDLLVRINFIDENPYYSLDEFIVQIRNIDGQLIASGRTNEKGEFLCKVNYFNPLFITVTSEDNRCAGESTVSILFKDNTTVSNVLLDAKASIDNPAYSCHCLCHNTLIKPIWVRILNILYNLFKIKYVCCDDMFASIGDLLVYTK